MLCSRVNCRPQSALLAPSVVEGSLEGHETPIPSTLSIYPPPCFFPFSIFTFPLSKHPSPRNSFVFKSFRTSLLPHRKATSFVSSVSGLFAENTRVGGVPSSSHFPSSLFHSPDASVLESTLARRSTNAHCKGLTENPSLLESTLMKKPGGGERHC